MLQFIFGKPSSGKTFTILNMIKSLSEKGDKCCLLVPEQFSFESEKEIVKLLGEKASSNVEVLSFTRLCDAVDRNVGGFAGILLSDSDKLIFMKRALNEVSSDLTLWSKYSNSINFAKTMVDTISEFKINSISSTDLKILSDNVNEPTLKAKLNDISLIFESYDLLLGEKFIDPINNITKLYNDLQNFNFFDGKTVFIDSFKGFTGQQYKIIERVLTGAKDVYIALTNDVDKTAEYNLFANIRIAVSKIKAIAKKHGIKIADSITLNGSNFSNESLSFFEEFLKGEKGDSRKLNGVTVCKCATPFDEAEFVARNIRKLVRTKNYRYRDFCVIARDPETYKQLISAACKKNDVSVFYDARIPLYAFPLSRAAESAIKAIRFASEDILNFHKTGLGTLSFEEISLLENYVFIWNIKGEMWQRTWDMNPDGLVAEENKNSKNKIKLYEINEIRIKAITPLINFKNSIGKNAKSMTSALINLFDECGSFEKLINLSSKLSKIDKSYTYETLRQCYDEFIKILNSLVNSYGEKDITVSDYLETINLALSNADIGVIPQMLDEVTFGAADRIRPSRPKIAFILGVNQGVFPKAVQNSGVFNLIERKNLIEKYELEISDNSIFSAIDEEYLLYSNLCCASNEVYISYSEQTFDGQALEPSSLIKSLTDNFELELRTEPEKTLDINNLPETESALVSESYKRLRKQNSDFLTLAKALSENNNTVDFGVLDNTFEKKITSENAQKLFGKNITLSATKLDTFYRCRFSFFCKYGLRVKKIQPAEFDVMQKGTIVHFVLESLINEHKDNLSNLTDENLDALTEKYVKAYLDSVGGFASVIDERIEFLISRLIRSLKEVVRHIALELSQSDFKPVSCELKIGGENAEIDSPRFKYSNGEVSIIGSIDRVDEYNGYIRIIDYKTGSKSFKLPDILFGLNLQMLIYLYSITRGKGISDDFAAGILYQPSKRDLNNKGMAMNGLLQADEALYKAMEKDGNGEFVPKLYFNKDGSISKRASSYIESDGFKEIFDHLEKVMSKTGEIISSGDIAVSPIDGRETPACKYCDFASVCAFENAIPQRVPDLSNTEVFEQLRKEGNNEILSD
ncbi:MAG: hypothetical protein E7560_01135 [Ruminococcaceae bacterium]|nr:hypothetical protein [Oscillospiraceae bacterium]